MRRSSEEPVSVIGTEVAGWNLALAAARGAAHEQAGRPMQDRGLWRAADGPSGRCLVVALADGHGHARHPRSASGAQFAVETFCDVAAEAIGGRRGESPDAEVSQPPEVDWMIPQIVDRWRAAIALDVAAHPLGEGALGVAAGIDPATSAYGTTLIGALVMPSWVTFLQIGDGDVIVVDADGTSHQPVPSDASLALDYTASLCQLDAVASFRSARVDLTASDVRWMLLATDGFANAQSDPAWHNRIGTDLQDLVVRRGDDWPANELHSWVAQCASSEGSRDDVTVALLRRT
jgi:serine/threonine protein phosphatase PrpC